MAPGSVLGLGLELELELELELVWLAMLFVLRLELMPSSPWAQPG